MKSVFSFWFNVGCIFICLLCMCGTAFFWYREWAAVRILTEEFQPISYAAIQQARQENATTTVPASSSEPVSSHQKPASDSVAIIQLPVDTSHLPPSIHLAVPFTSQAPEKNWDQPWQDACEEAAILMVDAYYEGYGLSPLFAKDELLKLLAYENQFGWGGSIDIEKIKQAFDYWTLVSGLTSSIVENPTVDDIKVQLAQGNPVLVVADGKVLPNPNFRNGGPAYHALVVRGYTEDSFITNDPGTQFGENFLYSYDDLMNSIRDWNEGDVSRGRRVILVFSKT